MALTRPRFYQSDTAVARIQDPITVLNTISTIANVDVGFIINRNLGTKSNVALYWNETGTEITLGFTANTGISDGNIAVTSYANLRAGTIYGNIGGGNTQANVFVTGSLIPSANVSYDLGTSNNRFRSLWLSGSTLFMGSESLSVSEVGNWIFTANGGTIQLGNSSIFTNITVTGNLNLQGSTTTFDSNNLVLQDSIIQLHTTGTAPLTGDDGRDIGLKFYYYKSRDDHAFVGWSNSTGYLEWYDTGYETAGNTFTGNTYGTIKSGALILANSTASTSTTTGALRVSGGAGIDGNVYVGTNLVVGSINVASNLTTVATNINTLFSNAAIQDSNLGTATTNISNLQANVGAYEIYANANLGTATTNISNLQANVGAYESWANARIQSIDANLGTATTNITTLSGNAATQQTQINNIVSGANANSFAYLTTTGATVAAATTAFTSQVQSNINAGTAYVSFVNATSGNVSQNVNTGLTYNPNTGNLTAYGLITTAGLFWANGTAFTSGGTYGNTQVAVYLPTYSGTIGGTLSGSSQPNVTDVGTLVNLDVSGSTYLTGFVTMDGTGGSSPQYSVKMGNADGEKLGVITRGTAGYGIGLETLKDDESGYGKLNVTASEIHFNIKNSVAATVLTNAIVVQANGIVTLDGITESSSATTGALVVRGGAAIGGNLYVGGNLVVSSVVYQNSEIITTTELVQGNLIAAATTASTDTTTGALVVAGGVGVAGNVYAGKIYTTNGLYWASNGVAFSSDIQANLGTATTNITTLFSNAASQSTTINTINANVGAYQTWANSNIGGLATSINSINSNVTAANSAIQTLSANIGTLVAGATGALDTLSELGNSLGNSASFSSTIVNWLGNITSNVTAANNSINTFNANLGAFEMYANTKIGTNTNSNLVVVATTASTDATTGALVVKGGVGIGGDIHIAGNIVPEANVTYDLGSSTNWFRDLWLSSGTIHIGGAQISQDSGTGAVVIIPQITQDNPNPVATIFSPTGAVTSANTAGGTVSSANVAAAIETNDFSITGKLTANTATVTNNMVISGNLTIMGDITVSNIGAYQIYANANAATQATSINTINANIGAYQTWANTSITSLSTNANANTAAYLTTYTGNTQAGNISVTGNINVTSNIFANKFYTTNGLYWTGNGVAFSSGVSFIASATPPSAPILGDQWYNTTDDVLYEFIANYWVDVQTPTIGASDYNNVAVNNISVTANITTANIYADRFFYSNGTAFSSSNYGNTQVAAYLLSNPQGSTYSNTNVEAYLGANLGTATTNITTLFGNAATQATSINTVNANIGAFQTYANLHFSDTSFSNSNVASYFTSNNSGMSSRTDAITIPIGTTGQRPTATANGMMRYNATLGSVEIYLPSGGWTSLISDRYTVEYLVVAGGGGGASRHSGGGGAGGMLTATGFTVTPTTAYTVTVGAGGAGSTATGSATDGSSGFDSVFSSITATGGGKGGGTAPTATGGNGGSGGGGGNGALGGSGTPGQGYAGGKNSSPTYDYHGGGGGGAGGVGGDVTGAAGGIGGPGATSDITGISVIYACGGGGSAYQGLGSGGDGGAGGSSNVNGGKGAGTSSGTAGTANTGTGGGGGSGGEGAYNGGSGVVIVRYLGPQRGSGGTYSSSGGYSIHRFTSSGTFTA